MGCVQGRIGEWDGTGVIGRPPDKYQLTNTSPLFSWDDGDHHITMINITMSYDHHQLTNTNPLM